MDLALILLLVLVYLLIGLWVFFKEVMGADNPGPIKFLIGLPWFLIRNLVKD